MDISNSESDTQEKNEPIKMIKFPSYSFYKFNKHKLKDEATDETETPGFSCITTNLTGENEIELRRAINKKAVKGSLLHSDVTGSIFNVMFGETTVNPVESVCYVSLLSLDRDELGSLLTEGNESRETFTVCLLTSHDLPLELFHKELDVFARQLVDLLEPDLLIELELREELGQLDGLDDRLQPVLSQWYPECTKYLTNCLSKFQEDTKYLIYCALSETKLDLKCHDDRMAAEIKKLMSCCSLSELLAHTSTKSDSHSDTSSSVSDTVLVELSGSCTTTSVGRSSDNRVQLVVNSDGTYHFEPAVPECTSFCEDWCHVLITGDYHNPVYIKQVIEDYRLRVIQDINQLKRMLREAETDFYALYRVYVFLSASANIQILLRQAQLEAVSSGNTDTLSTLAALLNFVQETSSLPLTSTNVNNTQLTSKQSTKNNTHETKTKVEAQ